MKILTENKIIDFDKYDYIEIREVPDTNSIYAIDAVRENADYTTNTIDIFESKDKEMVEKIFCFLKTACINNKHYFDIKEVPKFNN